MDYITKIKDILQNKFTQPPKANVVTFGCAQNENDSEKIRGLLSHIGYTMTDNIEDSDIVI